MNQATTPHKALTAEAAEAATLGAIILNPEVLGWVELSDDHFTEPLHRHTYAAMAKLWDDDKALDEITIINALEADVPSISLSAVSSLLTSTTTSDNIAHWVEILEEHRRKRVLSALAGNATTALLAGDESEPVFDSMIEGLMEISTDSKSTSETMEEVGFRVEEALLRAWDGSKTTRLPSGIAKLDREITGLPVGVPTAIGARPGVGKSLTLWNICYAAAKRGEHVVVLTNEDKADRTYKLGLANNSGVERRRLESTDLSAEEKHHIMQAMQSSAETNARYHTVPVHGKKMVEICRIAKALCRKHSPTIVAIDYIQNVPNPESGMSRNYGIEENLTLYDALIAEEDLVGIIVGQLKRMEPGAIPTMGDFKDSGSIEQKAKLMLTLSDIAPSQGQYSYPGEPNFSIGIVKNSEGLSDFSIDCVVNKGLGRFEA